MALSARMMPWGNYLLCNLAIFLFYFPECHIIFKESIKQVWKHFNVITFFFKIFIEIRGNISYWLDQKMKSKLYIATL